MELDLGEAPPGAPIPPKTPMSVTVPPKPDIGTSVGALVAFMQLLIAGTSETSEPIDTDTLVLVVDDSAEPAPL